MKEFGLIGRPLKHSYSKKIHAYLGEYHYDLYEIQPDTLKDFITNNEPLYLVDSEIQAKGSLIV